MTASWDWKVTMGTSQQIKSGMDMPSAETLCQRDVNPIQGTTGWRGGVELETWSRGDSRFAGCHPTAGAAISQGSRIEPQP